MKGQDLLKKRRFSRVGVYCGSSTGNIDSYAGAAVELGNELVGRGVDLVYGGGSIGLMGLVAKTVHDGGRRVLGIIPWSLIGRERTGETVGEMKAVANMHERKAEMARLSECFIALPGGYGTFEEFLEMICWTQLGIQDKPVGLLNVGGFYDSFLEFIDRVAGDGFIAPSQRRIMVSAPTAKELLQKLEEYKPVGGYLEKSAWDLERKEQKGSMVSLPANEVCH